MVAHIWHLRSSYNFSWFFLLWQTSALLCVPSPLGEAYHYLQFSSLATLPLCKSQEIYDFVDDSSLFFLIMSVGGGCCLVASYILSGSGTYKSFLSLPFSFQILAFLLLFICYSSIHDLILFPSNLSGGALTVVVVVSSIGWMILFHTAFWPVLHLHHSLLI